MLPDPTFFLAVILGLVAFETPQAAPAKPLESLAGVAFSMLMSIWLSRHTGRRALEYLEAGEDRIAESAVGRCTLWPLLGWCAAIFFFDWSALVQTYVPRAAWMVPYLLLLTPLLVMFGTAWAAQVPGLRASIERRGGIPRMRRPVDGVVMGLRRNAILLAPLLIFTAIFEALWLLGFLGVPPFETVSRWLEFLPTARVLASIGILLLFLPAIPRVVARLVRAEPLPVGPQRELLERAARRIKLRYHDILLWKTGGRLANAMVVGFTGGTRRIFVTDRLLLELPEDELLAVFFHEAGHAKRHHLPLFLVLAFGLMLTTSALAEPLAAIGISPVILFVAQLLAFWFLVLGWVSRRFEREADAYGAEHAGLLDEAHLRERGAEPLAEGSARMMRALDRIRRLAGRVASHRHGTIDSRIAFLARYATDPSARDAFRGAQRQLVGGILFLFLVGVVATAVRVPEELEAARAAMQNEDASQLRDEALALRADASRRAFAEKAFRRAYEGFASTAEEMRNATSRAARLQALWAEHDAGDVALDGLDEPELARPHFERVLERLSTLDGLMARPGTGALLRFNASWALGRIEAAAGPERLPAARRWLERLEVGSMQQEILEQGLAGNEIMRAHVELLRGVVAAREGDHEGARRRLEAILGFRNKGASWDVLRRAAQRELDALAGPRDD